MGAPPIQGNSSFLIFLNIRALPLGMMPKPGFKCGATMSPRSTVRRGFGGNMAEIDHLVIGAATLEAGAAWLERHLGSRPVPGGAHPGVGTHNMLLGLGPEQYIEIIAPDPAQGTPAHPRPFDLDDAALKLALEAEPQLIAYVAATPAIEAVVGRLGASHGGEVRAMRRGALSWRMAFPPQRQDMGNLIPPLIQWDGARAAAQIPDSGWRLTAFEAQHPDMDALRQAIAARGLEEAVKLRQSPSARLIAHLRHQDGREAVLASA